MAFKPISQQGESVTDHDELPWANVWRRTCVNPELPRLVHYVRKYDSGLMVVTYEFKAYVHVGTQQYTDLLEALQVWTDSKTSEPSLFCLVNKRGKPVLGIDEDKPNHRWVHSEDTYAQVTKGSVSQAKAGVRENPLLAGRGVQSTARMSEESVHTFPPQDVPVEASTRRRKAG